jgi:hypothetical protein
MAGDPDGTSSAAGPDLPARYTAQLTQIRSSAADLIQSPAVRDMFMRETQVDFERGRVAAENHARALSDDAQVAYVTSMGNKVINQAVAAKDDATRTQLIDTHSQLIDGLAAYGAITHVQAATMKQDWAHQYATADVLHRAETDPEGVINELRAKPGSSDAITNRIISIEGEGKNRRSTAAGTGQFIDSTWLDVLKRNRPDLANGRSDDELLLMRSDKQLARQMVDAYQKENAATLKGAGLEASPGNLYLAHFLGPAGAKAVLQANPDMPVSDALSKAFGAERAASMVWANPQILQGQLAGSVKRWADGKMGGAGPDGGTIYDMLRPDVREQLLTHAQAALQKQTVQGLSDFKARIEDSQAEAARTGDVKQPMKLSEFIGTLGADLGPKAYADYSANIQVARDTARVASMDPDEMRQLVASYEPKPGEGYAAAAARQDLVAKAMQRSMKERTDDPAGFAVTRLPGSQEAYKAYAKVASDPQASPAERGVAARSFASTTLLEQQRSGIPNEARQILPQADVERFKAAFDKAANADSPQARVALIAQVQSQRDMWGSYWPDVVRQLTPSMQPMVRAIAAGADTQAMTRLLSLDPKESPAQLLKEQSEIKSRDVRLALNRVMAPLFATMVGRQKDRDFFDYYNLADRLAALYVRDGREANAAAEKAFNDLIGNRYYFRDGYRIPKSKDIEPDDVQAGALAARAQLEKLGAQPSVDDIGGLSDPRGDSFAKMTRDGVWITSPDNSGLNLMYGDKSVRDAYGHPFFLSWGHLAQIGATPEARTAAFLRIGGVMGWETAAPVGWDDPDQGFAKHYNIVKHDY